MTNTDETIEALKLHLYCNINQNLRSSELRDAFGTLTNASGEFIFAKIIKKELKAVNYFRKKLQYICLRGF